MIVAGGFFLFASFSFFKRAVEMWETPTGRPGPGADEGHEVWEYTVQTDSATCYAIKHTAESLQEWGEPTANSTRRKASSGGVGAGARGFDLCTHEHGFHGNLSSESGIVGEVPESAISQRCKKRPHGCRTPGANGSTKSRPLSSLGSW